MAELFTLLMVGWVLEGGRSSTSEICGGDLTTLMVECWVFLLSEALEVFTCFLEDTICFFVISFCKMSFMRLSRLFSCSYRSMFSFSMVVVILV